MPSYTSHLKSLHAPASYREFNTTRHLTFMASGLAMVERLHRAGVPHDVIQPIIGDGQMGAAMITESLDSMDHVKYKN